MDKKTITLLVVRNRIPKPIETAAEVAAPISLRTHSTLYSITAALARSRWTSVVQHDDDDTAKDLAAQAVADLLGAFDVDWDASKYTGCFMSDIHEPAERHAEDDRDRQAKAS